MRRLPWRSVVRLDARAILTSLAIALGVAFAVVGFAVPAGLQSESISVEGPFARPDTILHARDGSPIEPLPGTLSALVARAPLAGGGTVMLLAIEGDARYEVAPGHARPVVGPEPAETVELADRTLVLAEGVEDRRLPQGWLLVAPALVRELEPSLAAGKASYLILPHGAPLPPRPPDVSTAQVPGVEPFFRVSSAEVARDLVLVITFASVLIALLVYEFLRAEVRERRREIAIWRSLGMQRRGALALLLSRAGLVTATGTALGLALASLTLAAGARLAASGIFSTPLSLALLAALALFFALAGMAGAAVPAVRAVRRSVAWGLEDPG